MLGEIIKRFTFLMNDFVSIFTRMKRYHFVGEDIDCNLCGNRSYEVIGTHDRYWNKLSVVICTNCGLVFLNPMPTDEELALFYKRYYRKLYHNSYEPRPKSTLRAFRVARRRYAFLQPILDRKTRLLDIGSGGGETVYYFREKGIQADGLEPNDGFAGYSKREYNIPIYTSSWQDAEIKDETYDVITAHHVVEHLHSPFEAITRFREWLVPGGYLYVSVPNIYNPNHTPFSRFHIAHLFYFNRESLIMMALKAGFEVSDKFQGNSTKIVFRKKTGAPPVEWLCFPDNYPKMTQFFRENTNLRYFLSPKPYARWIKRMRRLSGDILISTFGDVKSYYR